MGNRHKGLDHCCPNGKEQRVIKRRRFKHADSLSKRLVEDVEHLKQQLATIPHGPEPGPSSSPYLPERDSRPYR
jgi:hypothetical protein